MRITSGMMSSQYSRNLNRATYDLNRAATTAYDFRAFEKPSENPFLAAQTFQIRRQLALNENYSSNIENLKGAASSAQSTLQIVGNILANASDNSALKDLLAGITGTSNQSDRNSIADTLLTMRDAIVSDMNAQYGNRYLFSGAGGYGVTPFSVDADGNLLYRGVNVDTGVNTNGASLTVGYQYGGGDKSMQIDLGKGIGGKLNGYKLSLSTGTGATENAVSVDPDGKTIAITLKDGATKQDLQDLLQGAGGDTTFSDALNAAGVTDIGADDLSQITVSGLDEPGVGNELIGTDLSAVSGGVSSLSYKNAGGVSKTLRINFGGTSYDGYTVSLSTGASADAVAVDGDKKSITIKLTDGTTGAGLESLLQSEIGAGVTVGMDAGDTISVSGSAVSTAATDVVDLDALAHETSYVDIGLGMKTGTDGKVVDQSAYNAAMPGISFLGYGMTADTNVPKNVYSLLGDMADILKDDSLQGEDLMDAMKPYTDSFSSSKDELSSSLAKIGTNVNFLDSTNDFIDNVSLSLNTKDENVEFVDAADAITNYTMQQFSYTAALQIGTNILQSTLLDFMK